MSTNKVTVRQLNGSTTGSFISVSGTVSVRKDNFSGTNPPTGTDDTSAGYAIGSTWLDTTHKRVYICEDDTSSAAIWKSIGTVPFTNLTGVTTNYLTLSSRTVDAFVFTGNSNITHSDGTTIIFWVAATNSGACTLNVNSLGVTPLVFRSTALTAGAIPENSLIQAVYYNGNWEIQSGIYPPVLYPIITTQGGWL